MGHAPVKTLPGEPVDDTAVGAGDGSIRADDGAPGTADEGATPDVGAARDQGAKADDGADEAVGGDADEALVEGAEGALAEGAEGALTDGDGRASEDGARGARGGREDFPRRQSVRQSAREAAARTYARALPIVPVRARGMTIEGADGRRYLDCLSGAGALALGHNHPVVLEAIRKVLDSGAPLNALDLATPVKDAFVTELLRTLPPGLADRARVRFCGPTGSDAVRTAYELVRAAAGRPPGLAGDESAIVRVAPPQDCADLFRAGAAARPAGVIVEPVQGVGGVLPVPDAWMRRVRQLTADRSVPLISDEIQTGVGRTGTFWAVEHSGVTPDVMVLSEAIGGSLPLAVVVYRDDLDTGEPGPDTGTFRGNQLAMAAGTATLAHVRENRLAERASTLGARMLHQLRSLTNDFACVGEVRGRGLMIGVELVDTSGETETALELAAVVQRECLRRGLIVGLGGRHASVVRLLPPLTITDEQAAAVLDRLTDAIQAAAQRRQSTAGQGRTSRTRRAP
ncbi:aminotransferase class III-fold pyridoxal phosphate-dependent enzyme [Streptomyces sp. NPDC029554]|uniref:aminotransferase class III-fold pyridoxal phosphate-dependent enzyme n=1 Tax=Streptomyces sp. NPDC029554 TaxID=3155126 RepID=UPI0033F378DE